MLRRTLDLLRSDKGRDHVLTYLSEGLVLLGTIWVYRLAAKGDELDLDAYVVSRRTVSFIQPLLLMGLGVALTRAVAMSLGRPEQRKYLHGALRWMILPSALVIVIAAWIPGTLAGLVFGSDQYADLVLPVAVLVIALAFHSLAYSFHRGAGRMEVANILQVLGLAIAPNVAFLLLDDLAAVLWGTALAVLAFALVSMIPALLRGTDGEVGKHRSALLRYGIPRVPGDVALGGLLTIPVYVAGALYGLGVGGQMGVGVTLLNITAAAFAPVGLLLLPASAALLAQRKYGELRQQVVRTMIATLIISLGMLLVFELLAGPLLTLYLGDAGVGYVPMGRLLFLATPAFAFFIAMRSLVDAYFAAPRNGMNLLLSFGALLLWCALIVVLRGGPFWIAIGVVLAVYLLGYRTWKEVRFVLEELERAVQRTDDRLRLVVVIPGTAQGQQFPFARRQADVFAQRFQAEVKTFFLQTGMDPFGLLRARRELKTLLRQHRPDLVMVHYGTVTALFTVLTSSVPVVITFHGSDLNTTRSDGFLRDLLGRTFSQLAAFFAAGIITVSEGLRDRLWWRRDEVQVIPMGVDLQRFRPMDRSACRKELGWLPDEKVVLFNNNNPELKRIDIAEEAVRLARGAGLSVRLECLADKVNPERMPVVMNASDVLLLCSDREGSPTMVKEAMACGVPVVTSDVGDVRQRLQGVSPGAVTAQDAKALSEALIDVLRDGRRSNGREMASTNGIDSEELDSRTFAMIRSILAP